MGSTVNTLASLLSGLQLGEVYCDRTRDGETASREDQGNQVHKAEWEEGILHSACEPSPAAPNRRDTLPESLAVLRRYPAAGMKHKQSTSFCYVKSLRNLT